MQVLVSTDEVQSAPDAIKAWFSSKFGLDAKPEVDPVPKTEKVNKSKAKAEETTTTEKVETPSIQVLLEKAVAFINESGEDKLSEILKRLGIKRVKECPEDKRAALLAEIATHA